MAPRSVSRRPLSVNQRHQTYGLIVVPTVDRCNCASLSRDCRIFNCSALVSACTFICFALSFAALAFAFKRSTRFSAALPFLISSSLIIKPPNMYLSGAWGLSHRTSTGTPMTLPRPYWASSSDLAAMVFAASMCAQTTILPWPDGDETWTRAW